MASQPRAAYSRRQTFLNLQLLHQAQPMLPKIAQAIFEENGLEKLTQNLFNNISYYLLFLIDPQFHSSMTWPLYDTKAERAFRSELSRFICDYAAKGLITDVRSSYLVHPSCYKVTVLIHQLSLLALKQQLIPRIKGTEKQKLFDEVEEKYKNRQDDKSFAEYMKSVNYEIERSISDKISKILHKKQCCQKIAEMLHKKITENEAKLASLNAQGYIDGLVDGFVKKNELDELLSNEILKIKDISKPAPIFDELLEDYDKELDGMEAKWNAKVLPLLENSTKLYNMSEELIKREMGQIERCSYMIEYDPKKDAINTDELQSQVNSSQKYILKNIEQDGKLNFPNLIQAFVICTCYILKDMKFGEEIYYYNERVRVCQRGFSEVRAAFKALLERVDRGEKRLQLTRTIRAQPRSIEEHLQIPPIPDLSGLKMRNNPYQVNFDTFTPLNLSKHQFNLRRSGDVFARPQPRSALTTYHAPKDDFLKTLLSCRVSAYDRGNNSQSNDISVLSNNKANETVCSSGFTKEQVARLLSTKKKSSTKKHKKATESHYKIKKGALFDESVVSNDSHSLFRSYSSPNLLENRKTRPVSNIRGRKLSIMQEDSPPQLNVSGIACLDSKSNTPSGFGDTEISPNINNFPKISDEVKNRLANIQRELENNVPPISKRESRAKIVTASKIPRIISTASKTEQEMNFPNTENARELQESQLSSVVTAIELPRISISPITDQENHLSKTKTEFKSKHLARNSQESHISEIVTVKEIPKINVVPVTVQEPCSSQMVNAGHLRERDSSKMVTPRVSISPINMQESLSKTITPKPNTALIKKTSSLEKIINRFRQVRANVIPLREENENIHTNDGLTNRNLLPDLLSPGWSINRRSISDNNVDLLGSDPEDIVRRVSLGTVLGVDHTFLDQFDLSN